MIKVMCGVPKECCCGSPTMANQSLGKSQKMHGSHEEAFKCYAQWLLSRGYKQIGSREFMAPNDGPIEVLTKKVRFGAAMRPGKSADKGTTKNRFVPKVGHKAKAGVIV